MKDSNNLIKNINSPFTAIISLLIKYTNLPNGSLVLNYDMDTLNELSTHAGNAITILLHGTQDLGQLISFIIQEKKDFFQQLDDIGALFSGLANLIEALTNLRDDVDTTSHGRQLVALCEDA